MPESDLHKRPKLLFIHIRANSDRQSACKPLNPLTLWQGQGGAWQAAAQHHPAAVQAADQHRQGGSEAGSGGAGGSHVPPEDLQAAAADQPAAGAEQPVALQQAEAAHAARACQAVAPAARLVQCCAR